LAKLKGSVEPRSQGGASLGQEPEALPGVFQPADGFFDLLGKGGKLLPQGHRDRILQVGPAYFYDAFKLFGFGFQAGLQAF
jgi:hypothetical protein